MSEEALAAATGHVPAWAVASGVAQQSWTLDCGSVMRALVGWTAPDEIHAVPTAKLANESFTVTPEDISGWRGMTKTGLKAAMRERRSFLYKQEKAKRAAADIFAAPVGATLSSRQRKRTRAEMEKSGAVPDDGAPPPATVHVAIDCAYDDLMDAAEKTSLTEQLCVAHAATLSAATASTGRLALHITGCSDAMLADLTRRKGFLSWPMHVFAQPLEEVYGLAVGDGAAPSPAYPNDARLRAYVAYAACYGLDAASMGPPPPKLLACEGATSADAPAFVPAEVFPPPALPARPPPLVYLSADAEAVLTALEPGVVYIVGGLVDRNRHKGVAAARAAALGVPTARLPLQEHLAGRATPSFVLTTNHVVAILQAAAANGGDWASAFEAHLPRRKGFDVAPARAEVGGGGSAV